MDFADATNLDAFAGRIVFAVAARRRAVGGDRARFNARSKTVRARARPFQRRAALLGRLYDDGFVGAARAFCRVEFISFACVHARALRRAKSNRRCVGVPVSLVARRGESVEKINAE